MMRRLLPAILLFAPASAIAQETPVEPVTEAVPAEISSVDVVTKIEADGTVTMTHSLVVAAPATDVWTTVSTPAGWEDWAAPLARWAEGESDVIETSYDPAELPGGPGAIWQQLVARIPGRLLVFRTIKAPDDFPNGEEYKKVTSFFELEADGEATRLRLISTGYPDSDGGRALARFFAKGNAAALEALQRHFAKAAEPATEPDAVAEPPSE